MTGDVIVDSLHGIKDPLVQLIFGCLIVGISTLFLWLMKIVNKNTNDHEEKLDDVDQKVDKLGHDVDDIKKEQVNMNKQFKDSRNELVQAFKESTNVFAKALEKSEERQERHLEQMKTVVVELVRMGTKNEVKVESLVKRNDELIKILQSQDNDPRKAVRKKPGGDKNGENENS